MKKQFKQGLIVLATAGFLAGCISVGGTSLGFAKTKKFPAAVTSSSVSQYHHLGKSFSCKTLGDVVSKSYKMSKRGKSRDDIYWDLTPMDSTYAEQDLYQLLIGIGIDSATASNHTVFTEACRNNFGVYQSILDDQSVEHFKRVDFVYRTVYGEETRLYDEYLKREYSSMRTTSHTYGGSKRDVVKVVVQNKSNGGLDEITNEINNLIVEDVLEMLYTPAMMKAYKESPEKVMPSLDTVRAKMAPELVLKLVK